MKKGGWASDTTGPAQAERGRKSRKVSGWNKQPMCSGKKALASFNAYKANKPKERT